MNVPFLHNVVEFSTKDMAILRDNSVEGSDEIVLRGEKRFRRISD